MQMLILCSQPAASGRSGNHHLDRVSQQLVHSSFSDRVSGMVLGELVVVVLFNCCPRRGCPVAGIVRRSFLVFRMEILIKKVRLSGTVRVNARRSAFFCMYHTQV